MKKKHENMPPTISSLAMWAPARWRSANRPSGVIGCSARNSVIDEGAEQGDPRDERAGRPGYWPNHSEAARTKP